jgi:hypothetical protein
MSWWKKFFGQSSECASSSSHSPTPRWEREHQHDQEFSDLSLNDDPLYLEAARFVSSTRRCSVSALQRHLKIGYNRAAMLIESLEKDHFISEIGPDGNRYLLSDQQRQAARLLPSKTELERQRQAEELELRTAYLAGKYKDDAIVQAILRQKIWEGMTAAQLFDSAGNPEAVDQRYMKTKSREVWKYDHQGANRFALRVTLDHGVVVGWDSKG